MNSYFSPLGGGDELASTPDGYNTRGKNDNIFLVGPGTGLDFLKERNNPCLQQEQKINSNPGQILVTVSTELSQLIRCT